MLQKDISSELGIYFISTLASFVSCCGRIKETGTSTGCILYFLVF